MSSSVLFVSGSPSFSRAAVLMAAGVMSAGVMSAGVAGAQAAVTSAISGYEEIRESPGATSTYERFNFEGSGVLSHNLPRNNPATPSNASGYVNPDTGILRAYAIADTYAEGGATPGGFQPLHRSDRPAAAVNVSYTNQLIVGAGSTGLAPNTPVTLSLNLRLDGRMKASGPQPDPGNTDILIDMFAGFSVTDPTNIIFTGEGTYVQPSVEFTADARVNRYTLSPSIYGQGSEVHTYDAYWSAWSNHEEFFQEGSDSYDYEGDYPTGVTGTPPGYNFDGFLFDTGALTIQFDTYVGAVLDIEGSLNLLAQSRYNSPAAIADFLNTFGTSFVPGAGYEGLSLTLASSSVPEPGSAAVLAGPAMLLLGRRRR